MQHCENIIISIYVQCAIKYAFNSTCVALLIKLSDVII